MILVIRHTRMGAVTDIEIVSGDVTVERRWGNTHGEAKIEGTGIVRYIDISNRGNHRCELWRIENGEKVEVLKENRLGKFCEICDNL